MINPELYRNAKERIDRKNDEIPDTSSSTACAMEQNLSYANSTEGGDLSRVGW